MYTKLFRHKRINAKKLAAYGFEKSGTLYIYTAPLENCGMTLTVTLDGSRVSADVRDNSGEEYILHRVADAQGEFVGIVRSQCEKILTDIAAKCCDEEIFKSPQTQRIMKKITDKYGDEFEYLWEKAPDNAIVRRKDTQKWYAAILTVSRSKLGMKSDERAEIIDLHVPTEEIPHIVDNTHWFPGFHMNKKHWITAVLDDTLSDDELMRAIEISHSLGTK